MSAVAVFMLSQLLSLFVAVE